jgi:propanediol utilization protein
VDIRLLGPVSAAQREELAAEAAALLSYAAAGSSPGDVRISGAPGVRLAGSRKVMHR